MNNYKLVMGLEIHVELKTKSKMFCACSADYFGKQPNTQTCPVCLGLPGAVPIMNQQALEDCMKIGLALNCEVAESSRFERKNYFYPDLAKGYQISQYRWPLCINGYLDVTGEDGQPHRIRINRVHQEEDTGKLMHQGTDTLIDYNRAGVPLVEIVTEPDFQTIDQVKEYARKMQQLFRYLGVSNADMERGDMRLEANVSVKSVGQRVSDSENTITETPLLTLKHRDNDLPNYRVELKNINSFKFMGDAIAYEFKRQSEALERRETLVQETRGWNETKKETFSQRSKEEAHDYRYFPEPDLPELKIKDQSLKIKESMPELPWEAHARLMKLELSEKDATILTEEGSLLEYFEEAVAEAITHQVSAKEVANVIINQKIDISTVSVVELIERIVAKKTSVVSDEGQIQQWVTEVIAENPGLVEQYKSGKVTIIQALIGMVMRKSQGKADAGVVMQLLKSQLD